MLTLFLTGLASLCFQVQDAKPLDHKKALLGKWEITSVEWLGKPVPKEDWVQTEWEFTAKKASITVKSPRPGGADGAVEFPWTIDPSADPAKLDLESAVNPKLGFIAIYKLDGDSLTICWAAGRTTRPEKFACDDGALFWLTKLKRKK